MAKSHIVPKSYLEAWTDPVIPKGYKPYLHVFDCAGHTHRRRSPANIFYERDLYVIESGEGKSLRLEAGLSQLERSFSTIRRNKLETRSPLERDEYTALLAFLAAMHQRTPHMMNHHMDFWRRVREIGDDLEKNLAKGLRPPSGITSRNEPSMTLDEVRKITDRPAANNLAKLISVELKALYQLVSVTIFCTDTEPGFITSDAPAIWYDPIGYKRPPMMQGPALCYPSTEIIMPISPRLCLFGTPSYTGDSVRYVDVPFEVVRKVNRRVHAFCRKEFVVSKEVLDPYWFAASQVPEDS